jgi:hypothetical protein
MYILIAATAIVASLRMLLLWGAHPILFLEPASPEHLKPSRVFNERHSSDTAFLRI